MIIHLRLELESPEAIKDWELVKRFLGSKSNTDALRVLIKRTAIEVAKIQVENAKVGVFS